MSVYVNGFFPEGHNDLKVRGSYTPGTPNKHAFFSTRRCIFRQINMFMCKHTSRRNVCIRKHSFQQIDLFLLCVYTNFGNLLVYSMHKHMLGR